MQVLLCLSVQAAYAQAPQQPPSGTVLQGSVSATGGTPAGTAQCYAVCGGVNVVVSNDCPAGPDPYLNGSERFRMSDGMVRLINSGTVHCYGDGTCDHPAVQRSIVYSFDKFGQPGAWSSEVDANGGLVGSVTWISGDPISAEACASNSGSGGGPNGGAATAGGPSNGATREVPPPSSPPPGSPPLNANIYCSGRGGYNLCANPRFPEACERCYPAGTVFDCNPAAGWSWRCRVASFASNSDLCSLQQASDFSNKMRLLAENILQSTGRIAKASTDAMDVTQHNNVGIGIAFNAYFGALASGLDNVARDYQAVAAVGCTAKQQSEVLTIATEAAAESESIANQATETVTRLGAAGPAIGTTPPSVGYLEDIEFLPAASQPAIHQGYLPNCTVLACNRLAQLLGQNVSTFRVFDQIRPKVIIKFTPGGQAMVTGGLTASEVSSALARIGINAQVGTGLTNMMNELQAGRPVIAGVYTTEANTTVEGVHALVVEGLEQTQAGTRLKIYDPLGFVYWQPLSTFQKFFTGQFVNPTL